MRVRASHWAPAEFTKTARTRTKAPLKVTIHEKRLALFWDSKRGVPATISDICPHRGASLSVGGQVKDGCVKCKYHGNVVRPTAAEKSWVEDRGGIIWVQAGAGQLPESEKAPPTSDEFEGGCRVVQYSRSFEGCSPILCVENTLDWSHLDTVHAFHLIDGTPKVTILRGGHNGKAIYEYAFVQNRSLTIENEWFGPWSSCLRFLFDGKRAFTLHFSVRPESRTDSTLFVQVVRDPEADWLGALGDFAYMLLNELPLIEDRQIVRGADPDVWSQNKLTKDDAFLKLYRDYLIREHPDVVAAYVK
jgi:phenylpropionate dioxygenase-like ring-hydroxylating dioxygenase large terminal subunit